MQLLDWIVCDDIRFEQGGKKILIGMFDNEIKFNVDLKESFFSIQNMKRIR